jgi:Family of unknown function (DUF6174)
MDFELYNDRRVGTMPDVEQINLSDARDSKKPDYFVIVIFGVGAILILTILIYAILSYSGFWQLLELKQNQTKWESRHITHYQFALNFSGYGNDRWPITVEVKDEKVVKLIDPLGHQVSPTDIANIAPYTPNEFTIMGLFAFAQETVSKHLPSMHVTYESTFGYPKEIYIDPFVEPCCQDYSLDVKDFKVLSP